MKKLLDSLAFYLIDRFIKNDSVYYEYFFHVSEVHPYWIFVPYIAFLVLVLAPPFGIGWLLFYDYIDHYMIKLKSLLNVRNRSRNH